jgi:protein phosphatase
VVGDVHGDARGFAAAVATDRFVIQVGDLTDGGGDSAEALRIALRLIEDGNGLFLMGNHDHKLARALAGRDVRVDEGLARTLAEFDADPPLRAQAAAVIPTAPFWLRDGARFFVHGGFHPDMLTRESPPFGTKVEGAVARALFGQTTGRMQPDGYPERVLDWVNRIPPGLAVYCGHDRRSTDGRPYIREGALGGRAAFLDTGAGKGGHLSWIDLPL